MDNQKALKISSWMTNKIVLDQLILPLLFFGGHMYPAAKPQVKWWLYKENF